jgi:transposase-like protein
VFPTTRRQSCWNHRILNFDKDKLPKRLHKQVSPKTNPLESVFAGVRLRTDVAKQARKREKALYLVYKIVKRLSHNWRALNGGPRLMQTVAAGAAFRDAS